jgi:TRAP-type mannitol/chloroaromatic compound transport system substrate-binding protein
MGGWFNKEINSVNDLEGLKMRIPGLGGRVISKAGGSPLLSPGGEIYTNLERGVIDATEWIGPYHDYKMGFQDVAKYYYYPGWHEPSTAFELFMNKSRFDSMPEDLQEIIRNGVGRLNIWGLSEFETQNIKSLRKIQQEGKVQITPFPKEVLTRLKELTDETLAEITAQDAESKKIYTAYQSFQQEMNDWAGYTEKLYYSQLR